MNCYNYIHWETKRLVKIFKTHSIYELGKRYPIIYGYEVIDINNNLIICSPDSIKSLDKLTPEEKLEML